MKAIARCGSAMLVGLLLGTCDRTSTLVYDQVPGRMVSIAYLKSLCDGPRWAVTQQLTISGRITANNRYGEFPYEIVIEDASGGIAIAADYPALKNPYPLGRKMTVYCNGLTLYDYGGKIEMGKPHDDATIWDSGAERRIPAEELARYLRLTDDEAYRPAARPIALKELTPYLTDTYVRIDEVGFAEQGPWCDRDPQTGRPMTTERHLTDPAGNPLPLSVRTSGTAIYADEPLPSGCGSLCGILDYFAGAYTLRITAFETAFVPTAATPATAYP